MEDRTMENFAYQLTMLMQARIEMEGMIAENQHRASNGHSPLYGYDEFVALIDKHGIHHNAVLTVMQNGR